MLFIQEILTLLYICILPYTAIYTAIYTYQNLYPLTLHHTREDNNKNEITYFYLSHCICEASRP